MDLPPPNDYSRYDPANAAVVIVREVYNSGFSPDWVGTEQQRAIIAEKVARSGVVYVGNGTWELAPGLQR